MTLDEIKNIIQGYRRDVREVYNIATGSEGGNMSDECYEEIRNSRQGLGEAVVSMSYLLKFLDKFEAMLNEPEPDRDKAMRWLGFVQGALWMSGAYGIAKLRDHNKTGVVPVI